MLDQLGAFGDIVVAVSVIFTALAAAFAALNASTVKTLRENNKDLTDRVTILEATEIRLGGENTQLNAENDVLRSVVTGDVKLASIETLLDMHHRESVNAWNKANDELSAIRRSIEGKS